MRGGGTCSVEVWLREEPPCHSWRYWWTRRATNKQWIISALVECPFSHHQWGPVLLDSVCQEIAPSPLVSVFRWATRFLKLYPAIKSNDSACISKHTSSLCWLRDNEHFAGTVRRLLCVFGVNKSLYVHWRCCASHTSLLEAQHGAINLPTMLLEGS